MDDDDRLGGGEGGQRPRSEDSAGERYFEKKRRWRVRKKCRGELRKDRRRGERTLSVLKRTSLRRDRLRDARAKKPDIDDDFVFQSVCALIRRCVILYVRPRHLLLRIVVSRLLGSFTLIYPFFQVYLMLPWH